MEQGKLEEQPKILSADKTIRELLDTIRLRML